MDDARLSPFGPRGGDLRGAPARDDIDRLEAVATESARHIMRESGFLHFMGFFVRDGMASVAPLDDVGDDADAPGRLAEAAGGVPQDAWGAMRLAPPDGARGAEVAIMLADARGRGRVLAMQVDGCELGDPVDATGRIANVVAAAFPPRGRA